MGGYNSGRYGGGPTVESGLTLDLYQLIRDGTLRPGQPSGGTLTWTYTITGELLAPSAIWPSWRTSATESALATRPPNGTARNTTRSIGSGSQPRRNP